MAKKHIIPVRKTALPMLARRRTPPRRMRWQECAAKDKAIYAKCKSTEVEPVFGIVKQVMGFRQFLLRGLRVVTGGMDAGQYWLQFEAVPCIGETGVQMESVRKWWKILYKWIIQGQHVIFLAFSQRKVAYSISKLDKLLAILHVSFNARYRH